jgi:uncharacterized membrane protein
LKQLPSKEETKQFILEVIAEEKPKNAQTLKEIMLKQKKLNPAATTQLLIELENEGKLHFTQPEIIVSSSLKEFSFSNKERWFWAVTAISVATILSVFTIPEANYPIAYIRNILGIIFVLFLPGYAFIKALFPTTVPIKTTSENLDNIERIALSFGMSLALVPIVGLILNYTPLGIRLAPITLSLLALTMICATAALIREYQSKTNQTQPSAT